MVDVSAKSVTAREAIASAEIVMAPATADVIQSAKAAKGDVLAVARLAGIQATKLTSQLIPLCHAIPIESVSVDFSWKPNAESPADAGAAQATLICHVRVRTSAKTGVEMEAMTAASIAALTVYDMVKSIDRGIEIGPVVLEAKSGGKSGDYRRQQKG
tara:strand:- start:157 stop:630 length:474 start_codon:yes stop_codon:yes gene_type:complete